MKGAILRLGADLWLTMLGPFKESPFTSVRCVENAIPPDARVVSAWTDDDAGYAVLNVLLESDHFDDVPHGGAYPVLATPVLETEVHEEIADGNAEG